MKNQYQHAGTSKKYLDYLQELYDLSCVESTFNLNDISRNHNVTRVIGTVVKNLGIIQRHRTKRSTYKWTAAKPTITMAAKVREAIVAYNSKEIITEIVHTPKKKKQKTVELPLIEERVPFFSMKIGRLKISF